MVDSDKQAMAVLVKITRIDIRMGLHRQARVRPAIVCAVAAALLTQSAVADEGDTLNVTVAVTRTYNDNVFSVPDTALNNLTSATFTPSECVSTSPTHCSVSS